MYSFNAILLHPLTILLSILYTLSLTFASFDLFMLFLLFVPVFFLYALSSCTLYSFAKLYLFLARSLYPAELSLPSVERNYRTPSNPCQIHRLLR